MGNLNLLGERAPVHYSSAMLAEIDARLAAAGRAADHEVVGFQRNAEHELVGRVQGAPGESVAFLIVNPAPSAGRARPYRWAQSPICARIL